MYLAARNLIPKDWQPADITLYSCWMSFDAYAAALLKREFPEMRFVARGHAFDIDVERNPLNPYLMKQAIADAADSLHPICGMAEEQMMSYLQGRVAEQKVQVLPFGSAGEQPAELMPPPLHTEGVLRIVSCAKVIPIKQVNVLLEALARWEGAPVHWTHIGDGEGLPELRQQAEELLDPKENVIVSWLGNLPADQVLALYENQPFDVIINTSRKEGVPVSIMEAMRCGLPAIAPAVGGLPELVTPDTGWLYDPAEGADGVIRCLALLAAESPEQARNRRLAAAACWQRQYRNTGTLEKLFQKPELRRRNDHE
jgi:glycosyltransferase involved in cell wall biosynthesis